MMRGNGCHRLLAQTPTECLAKWRDTHQAAPHARSALHHCTPHQHGSTPLLRCSRASRAGSAGRAAAAHRPTTASGNSASKTRHLRITGWQQLAGRLPPHMQMLANIPTGQRQARLCNPQAYYGPHQLRARQHRLHHQAGTPPAWPLVPTAARQRSASQPPKPPIPAKNGASARSRHRRGSGWPGCRGCG